MSQIPSDASRRARLADQRLPRCLVCQATDVTGSHVDRCEERHRYLSYARASGAVYDIPRVTIDDLHAHLASRVHNELVAAFVVELVCDLGWRPVVGSDPRRLWHPEAASVVVDDPTYADPNATITIDPGDPA